MRTIDKIICLASVLLCGATLAQANPLFLLVGAQHTTASYTPYATQFAGDGQAWLERDSGLTGAVDTATGFIFSCWVKFTAGDGVEQTLIKSSSQNTFSVTKRTTNLIRIVIKNASNTPVVQLDQASGSVAAILAGSGWHHIIASANNVSSSGFAQLYIDGVSCGTQTTFAASGAGLDFVEADWGIGASVGGTLPLQGDLSELFLISGSSLDLSVASNLQKFRSTGGKPVSLGTDGTTPTGTAPLVYLRSAYDSFTTNSGTGGNFVKYGTTALASATAP